MGKILLCLKLTKLSLQDHCGQDFDVLVRWKKREEHYCKQVKMCKRYESTNQKQVWQKKKQRKPGEIHQALQWDSPSSTITVFSSCRLIPYI